MLMVDGEGRRLEVILLDRGHGPKPYIRVSWHHRMLLGRGYYRRAEMHEALRLVDVESLVEVIEIPVNRTSAGHGRRSDATLSVRSIGVQ